MSIRRRLTWCLGLICVFAAMTAAAFGATTQWGTAIGVPGLEKYADDQVRSISCTSAGNCTAVGSFRKGDSFVVTEKNGVWGKAITVPYGVWNYLGLVSCATRDSCAAGGSYFDGTSCCDHALLVNKAHGAWGKAMPVRGVSLDASSGSYLSSLSCARPGFCAATVGEYGSLHLPFLVDERNGVWLKAIRVPGPAVVRSSAVLNAVSCGGAGSCAAGGSYMDSHGVSHAYLAEEAPGVWWKAVKLPGDTASVESLACTAPGFCGAGGTYSDSHGVVQAFVADETHGVWHKPIGVPGLAALNVKSPGAQLYSISCATAGSCAAVGSYTDSTATSQPFVVSEKSGKWGKAIPIPGLAALQPGNRAAAYSISCGAVGFCAAGGYYQSGSTPYPSDQHAFVVTETNGVWNTAIEVPGSAALNTAFDAAVNTVSCGGARSCVAGGYYVGDFHATQSFVTSP